MKEPYYFVPDCPNCGQKDEQDKWLGARVGSTSWGHNFMCCSEKCGLEFAKNPKRLESERNIIKQQIAMLQERLRQLK